MKNSLALAASLFVLTGTAAYAQAPEQGAPVESPVVQGEVTSYPPSFFAPYNPVNAWDMITRIPGFGVDTGSNQRGLSGTAGNVLINGERPPGKTDLDDILDRLRAEQIERIDLIRGGAPGIDMQGKAMVINIIRLASTGGYSGAVEAGTRYLPGVDRGDGWLELTGAWEMANGVKFDGELSYNQARGESAPGERRVRVSPTGALISSLSSQSDEYEEELSGRASTEFGLLGGDAKLTGTFETSQEGEFETERLHAGPPRLTEETGEETSGEFEASYTYSLANGGRLDGVFKSYRGEDFSDAISLSGRPPEADSGEEKGGEIGLTASYPLRPGLRFQSVFAKSWDEESSVSTSLRSGGTLSSEIDYEEVGETALRTSLFFDPYDGLAVEAGAEAAYNFLEGSSEIALNGVSVEVPGSQAKVDERRGEVFAVATWKARPSLTLDGALRYEFSTLTTSGARKELAFFKPMLRARWQMSPDREISARVERTVGQLDFGVFLSSASISEFDEIITAGAVDLTPTQTWRSAVEFRQQFWETGVFRAELQHLAFSDVIDNRPIVTATGEFEGTGNIGDARRVYFNSEIEAPLDRVGIPGGRLTLEGQLILLSELTDPFTGEARRFGGDRDYEFEMYFEQEIRAWNTTWGFGAEKEARWISYRRNSVEVFDDSPYFSAFVSYRPDSKSTVRLSIDNIVTRRHDSRRVVYAGQRDIAPASFIETRRNESIPMLSLSYRRTTR